MCKQLRFAILCVISDGFFLADDDDKIPTARAPLRRDDIRLEDFFWTGLSGDGPPPALPHHRPPNVGGGHSGDNGGGGGGAVRTSTLYATVYVNDDELDAETICARDCDFTVVDGRLDAEAPDELHMPDDRRFWLLTVLSGHQADREAMRQMQERLAALYRLAFSRCAHESH